MPPALAASATPHILELLGDGPGRVLELGFAGIHAPVLELAGWDVVVVSDDWQARERSANVADQPVGRFDAVIAPAGTDLTGIYAGRMIVVGRDGSVHDQRSI
jgi:hypothetical protein